MLYYNVMNAISILKMKMRYKFAIDYTCTFGQLEYIMNNNSKVNIFACMHVNRTLKFLQLYISNQYFITNFFYDIIQQL